MVAEKPHKLLVASSNLAPATIMDYQLNLIKMNLATNEIIGEYVSATHAAKENPQCDAHGIRHVIRGSLKTHKGFIWKKTD